MFSVDSPTITHNYHQQPKPSVWPKALLGAGLLATGIGGPIGAWMVADAIRNRPQPEPPAAVQPVEPVEPAPPKETIIDWELGEPRVE